MVLVLGTSANRAAAPCELPLDPLPRALEKLGKAATGLQGRPLLCRDVPLLWCLCLYSGRAALGMLVDTLNQQTTASTPRLAEEVLVHECRSAVARMKKRTLKS